MLQPVGLVVSPPALVAAQAFPDKNIAKEQQALLALLADEKGEPKKPVDFATLATTVLGWKANKLAMPPEELSRRLDTLEERLLETKGQLAQKTAQNEKLSYTLREAREHIASLRDEVDKLTQPPNAYGVVVGKNDDGTVDVLASGRKMKVQLHPDIDHDLLDLAAHVTRTSRLACQIALSDDLESLTVRMPGGAYNLDR